MLLHQSADFCTEARTFGVNAYLMIGCDNPLTETVRHSQLFEIAKTLTTLTFEQNMSGAEFFN